MKALIDQEGRQIRKLRLSLTDKCNLRCHYCMPVDAVFMDEAHYLLPNEIFEMVKDLTDYGLEEVRLTGGEPLMRKAFPQIVEMLSKLKLKKLALTTNGIFLEQHFDLLEKARVHHLNISLDSLDEENFQRITKGHQLKRIIANIRTAREKGFHVKLNMVAMKGINDHEVLNFVKFAETEQVEVRFLELMKIGYARQNQSAQFISAKELIQTIERHYELKPITLPKDSTSFNYLTQGGGQIGFIASESLPFCGHCSRWRLSADGTLRACLLKDDGLSIKNKTVFEREILYQTLLGMKPRLRPPEVAHHMNAIGG